MSFFTFFRKDDNPFGRIISKKRIESIRDDWITRCKAVNQPLSKKAIKELEKRVYNTKAGDIGGKPKLDLSNCEINDGQLKFLLQILSSRPSIQYLGLSYNDISDEVRLLHSSFYTQQYCTQLQLFVRLVTLLIMNGGNKCVLITFPSPSLHISLSLSFSL